MGSFIETLSSRVKIQFTMGTIFVGFDQVKEMDVVVKQISLSNIKNGIPSVVLREISVLKELDHRNVVRLLDVITKPLDVITTPTDLGLVFEYNNYTLAKIMRTQAEPKGPEMVKRVIHGNLNMQNLLINESTHAIKIGGFSFSRTFDALSRLHTPEVTGSFAYKAPEVLLRLKRSAANCIFVEKINKEPLLNGATANECLSQMIRVFGVPSGSDGSDAEANGLGPAALETTLRAVDRPLFWVNAPRPPPSIWRIIRDYLKKLAEKLKKVIPEGSPEEKEEEVIIEIGDAIWTKIQEIKDRRREEEEDKKRKEMQKAEALIDSTVRRREEGPAAEESVIDIVRLLMDETGPAGSA